MLRRQFFMVVAGAAAFLASAQLAQAKKPAVYTGVVEGTGAGGYDVVAYQTQDDAVPGDAAITTEHDGVSYRFASEANRSMFEADPEKYLPRYGGYCAYAVAQGATAHGDPAQWTVHEGKLYLNYSAQVRRLWRQDIPGNLVKSEANWPGVLE